MNLNVPPYANETCLFQNALVVAIRSYKFWQIMAKFV